MGYDIIYTYIDLKLNNADNDDGDVDKTLAIIIGIIAGVAGIIVFLSFLARLCDRKGI